MPTPTPTPDLSELDSGLLLEIEEQGFQASTVPGIQFASLAIEGSGVLLPAAQLEMTVQPVAAPAVYVAPVTQAPVAASPAPAAPAPVVYAPKQDRN